MKGIYWFQQTLRESVMGARASTQADILMLLKMQPVLRPQLNWFNPSHTFRAPADTINIDTVAEVSDHRVESRVHVDALSFCPGERSCREGPGWFARPWGRSFVSWWERNWRSKEVRCFIPVCELKRKRSLLSLQKAGNQRHWTCGPLTPMESWDPGVLRDHPSSVQDALPEAQLQDFLAKDFPSLGQACGSVKWGPRNQAHDSDDEQHGFLSKRNILLKGLWGMECGGRSVEAAEHPVWSSRRPALLLWPSDAPDAERWVSGGLLHTLFCAFNCDQFWLSQTQAYSVIPQVFAWHLLCAKPWGCWGWRNWTTFSQLDDGDRSAVGGKEDLLWTNSASSGPVFIIHTHLLFHLSA